MAKRGKNPWSEYSESHWFERFLDHPTFHYRKMFGCLAIYFQGRMVAVLAQTDDPSWNGILLPSNREHHAKLFGRWPDLVNHPILPKWLYLTMEKSSYEATMEAIVDAIEKRDPLLGIEPKGKK